MFSDQKITLKGPWLAPTVLQVTACSPHRLCDSRDVYLPSSLVFFRTVVISLH
jgi:hypothetical protein